MFNIGSFQWFLIGNQFNLCRQEAILTLLPAGHCYCDTLCMATPFSNEIFPLCRIQLNSVKYIKFIFKHIQICYFENTN